MVQEIKIGTGVPAKQGKMVSFNVLSGSVIIIGIRIAGI